MKKIMALMMLLMGNLTVVGMEDEVKVTTLTTRPVTPLSIASFNSDNSYSSEKQIPTEITIFSSGAKLNYDPDVLQSKTPHRDSGLALNYPSQENDYDLFEQYSSDNEETPSLKEKFLRNFFGVKPKAQLPLRFESYQDVEAWFAKHPRKTNN